MFNLLHMLLNALYFLCLPCTEWSVCRLNFFYWRLAAAVDKRRNIKLPTRMFQHEVHDSGRALAEHVAAHAVKLQVGYGKAVVGAVLLAGRVPGQHPATYMNAGSRYRSPLTSACSVVCPYLHAISITHKLLWRHRCFILLWCPKGMVI